MSILFQKGYDVIILRISLHVCLSNLGKYHSPREIIQYLSITLSPGEMGGGCLPVRVLTRLSISHVGELSKIMIMTVIRVSNTNMYATSLNLLR